MPKILLKKRPKPTADRINLARGNIVRLLSQVRDSYWLGAAYAAVVETDSGLLYDGLNYFSSTQTLTVHAEHAAFIHAAIHGHRDVTAIYSGCDDNITTPHPCGNCLQIIYEFCRRQGIDIPIVVFKRVLSSNRVQVFYVSELYPYPWPDRPPQRIRRQPRR